MRIRFVHEAKLDSSTPSHTTKEKAGLGRRFKAEVDRSLQWLLDHSEACRLRPSGYRELSMRIFPYQVAHVVKGSTLWILAVAHRRRKPEYWIQRTTNNP